MLAIILASLAGVSQLIKIATFTCDALVMAQFGFGDGLNKDVISLRFKVLGQAVRFICQRLSRHAFAVDSSKENRNLSPSMRILRSKPYSVIRKERLKAIIPTNPGRAVTIRCWFLPANWNWSSTVGFAQILPTPQMGFMNLSNRPKPSCQRRLNTCSFAWTVDFSTGDLRDRDWTGEKSAFSRHHARQWLSCQRNVMAIKHPGLQFVGDEAPATKKRLATGTCDVSRLVHHLARRPGPGGAVWPWKSTSINISKSRG